MIANGTAKTGMPPPPPPPPVQPTIADSLYNVITRRIRAANTIFGSKVKLVLREQEEDQWSKMKPPYLLVVPTQTRVTHQRQDFDSEVDSFVLPRSVTLIAQLSGRDSEAEYLAAVDIETAEKQLIFALVNWRPVTSPHTKFQPTAYTGMRIQGAKRPDVKVAFIFTFYEEIPIPDEWLLAEDVPQEVVVDQIHVHVSDPCCDCPTVPEPAPMPDVCVSGGGCVDQACDAPCADQEPCPPIFEQPKGVTP